MLSSNRCSRLFGLITALGAAVVLFPACQGDMTQEQQQMEPELPDNELVVEQPWVEPASRGDSTTLYMTVANGRSQADTLLGARAPIFDGFQIYSLSADTAASGQMEPGSTLSFPAQKRMSLNPDTSYVVLRNLNQNLSEGGTMLVTMEFAQSGLQQVQARVGSPSNQQ